VKSDLWPNKVPGSRRSPPPQRWGRGQLGGHGGTGTRLEDKQQSVCVCGGERERERETLNTREQTVLTCDGRHAGVDRRLNGPVHALRSRGQHVGGGGEERWKVLMRLLDYIYIYTHTHTHTQKHIHRKWK